MIKRQQRLLRIADVDFEYLAAKTAAEWLDGQMAQIPASVACTIGMRRPPNPSPATWRRHISFACTQNSRRACGLLGHLPGATTRPDMVTLIRNAAPTQTFTQDCVDDADDVRIYRNFLVHDMEEEPPSDMVTFTVLQAKKNLCTYCSCLNPRWR